MRPKKTLNRYPTALEEVDGVPGPDAARGRLTGGASGRPSPSGAVSDGAAAKNGGDGRGPAGRFAKGNKHGRGNPFARKLGAMRSAFLDAVTGDDVKRVAAKLLERSLSGDLAAAQLLLSYVLGKPTQAVDVDRLDLDEFAIAAAAPTAAETRRAMVDGVDPAAAAEAALVTATVKDTSALSPIAGMSSAELGLLNREREARTGTAVGS